jgi:hypothetical protein
MRFRKKFIYKTDNEFVADDEPEIFCFDLRKRLEILWIHSADGVGKIRREHRNAIALGDDTPASGTFPADWPDPIIVGNRLYRTARKASPAGYGCDVHVGRAPGPSTNRGWMIVRDFIIRRL